MRFKQAGFLTKIVVLALLIYMTTSLLDLRGQIQATQSQRDTLAQQVADQRLEKRLMTIHQSRLCNATVALRYQNKL